MNLSVIIPYRADGGVRTRQLEFQLRRFKQMDSSIEVIVSEDKSKSGAWIDFNKSRLLNEGVSRATKDNILILDVDVVLNKSDIEKALELVNEKSIVLPYTKINFMNKTDSDKVLKCKPKLDYPYESLHGLIATKKELDTNGTYFVTKENYWKAFGHEELYVGWGGEDGSFISACVTLIDKPYVRLEAHAIHLWHEKTKIVRQIKGDKRELYTRYLKARYNKEEMLSIIKERNGKS